MGTARKTQIKAKKANLVQTFGTKGTNTGTTEVQIALITDRINTLTPHFQKHSKDHASRLGLLKLVGQRRRLLNYLKARDEAGYNQLLSKLELRK
ncbi:MAG: 30S ribosomal protein S15 [Proteobacteria bacterium]|nr:30S ribosomal protein S15 [Pseudomonadota bacterium]